MTSPPPPASPPPPPPPRRGMTSYALEYQYPPTPGMELYGTYAYQCPPHPGPSMAMMPPYWINGSQYPPPPPPPPPPAGPGIPVMTPYWTGSQYPPPPGPGPGPGMPPHQYPPASCYPNIPPPNNQKSSSFMKGALLGKLIYETGAADALSGSEDLHFLS